MMEHMTRSFEGMVESGEMPRIVLLDDVAADQFVGNQDIHEVECAKGVCQIGERAFKRCAFLRTISLPSTFEKLGRNAFSLCESLVSVKFSEPENGELERGLKTVEKGTFFGCLSLVQINIPSTVETIESCAFEDCTSLQELQLSAISSLRTIGERAFEGCTLLREIHLPGTVTAIEERAFKQCICLTQVALPKRLLKIGDRALEQCRCLESVGIPSTVADLPYGVFLQCASLMDVTLHEGLKTLGTCAFKSCGSLRRIKIPSTVDVIGSSCFQRCTSLKDVQFSSPSGLKVLCDFAFANCRSLYAISLPQSIETIGLRAFRGCSKLVTAEFSVDCNAKLDLFVFRDCGHLTNIWVPAPMHKNVADCVFEGCDQLHKEFGKVGIVKALAHRFQRYPIHEKCYHASETTAQELQASIGPSTLDDSTSWREHQDYHHLVDSCGMTPFHLVLSSAKRRTDLVKVLLNWYPPYTLGWKDKYGKRAMDYLAGCDWTDDTKSLMQLILKRWTIDRLVTWGQNRWQEEISRRLDALLNAQNQGLIEMRLENISAAMERYERFEATLLLELWLWKMKIKSSLLPDLEWDVLHRSSCRFQCGASFVVPVVIGWLDKLSGEG